MVLLPFDAHNHVQLGSSSPSLALKDTLSGMAVMSTHPRDFPLVADLAKAGTFSDTHGASKTVIACMGIHPWFLHELTQEDWETPETNPPESSNTTTTTTTAAATLPRWVLELESLLQADPSIAVGEIGLDNFHFNDPVTKELSTDMETQMLAMEYQLSLAIRYQRPVSLHCVRAMGPMLQIWNKILQQPSGKKKGSSPKATEHKLPPRVYFHAFGGKAATVIQLIRLLEPKPKKQKKKKKPRNFDGKIIETKEEEGSSGTEIHIQSRSTSIPDTPPGPRVYFGFAPIVNFQSPKTLEVIQEVGLERLVLETDHEEAHKVSATMKEGLRVISEAFDITEEQLIRITNKNAQDLFMCASNS